jgi:HD-like signal output (HDOD) protein
MPGQKMANSESIDKLINQVKKLPPLPQIAHKTLALLRDPKSNMSEIASLIGKDQMMTSTVLSWANSAHYGVPHKVTTVHQAIMYLGQVTVQTIVFNACMATYLNRPLPGYGLERGDLWKHSIGVAAGARLIVAKYGKTVSEEAYFSGLLCDIGKLAFDVALRETDLDTPTWQDRPFEQTEKEVFGINHAALGSQIAQSWMLPTSICHAITFHHEPSKAEKDIGVITSAVHIADLATMMMGLGLGRDGLLYTPDPKAFEILDFRETDLPILLDKISEYIHEVANEFGLGEI